MAPADKNNPKAAKADAKKTGKPWLRIVAITLITAVAGGGGAWYFVNHSGETKAEQAAAKNDPKTGNIPAPAQYFALEPPFVVNLIGSARGARYLQVEVQLMTRDPEALKSIQLHAPAIRAKLLMLFAQQDAEGLITRAGKERLQNDALTDVKKLLIAETGKPSVEALLFTSFVMQ